MNKKEMLIMMWQAEMDNVELRIKDRLVIIKRHMTTMDKKLESGSTIYFSDGMQGLSIEYDALIAKYATLQRCIEDLKNSDI